MEVDRPVLAQHGRMLIALIHFLMYLPHKTLVYFLGLLYLKI